MRIPSYLERSGEAFFSKAFDQFSEICNGMDAEVNQRLGTLGSRVPYDIALRPLVMLVGWPSVSAIGAREDRIGLVNFQHAADRDDLEQDEGQQE